MIKTSCTSEYLSLKQISQRDRIHGFRDLGARKNDRERKLKEKGENARTKYSCNQRLGRNNPRQGEERNGKERNSMETEIEGEDRVQRDSAFGEGVGGKKKAGDEMSNRIFTMV